MENLNNCFWKYLNCFEKFKILTFVFYKVRSFQFKNEIVLLKEGVPF